MDKPVLVHHEAFGDLNHGATIRSIAERCETAGGARAVREILSSPIYCRATLRARARDVSAFLSSDARARTLGESVRDDEEGAEWCARDEEDVDEDTLDLLDQPYFRNPIAGTLNGFWPALWANNAYAVFAAPALALAAPLSYLIAPYFLIRVKLRIPLDFRTFVKLMYHSFKGAGAAMNIVFGTAPSFAMQLASVAMTIVAYFQNVLATFRHSFSLLAVCKKVVSKMNCLARFIERCDEHLARYDDAVFSRWIVCDPPVANEGPAPCLRPDSVLPWKTGFARALRDFRALDRTWIRSRMRRLFCVDALAAIAGSCEAMSLKPAAFLKPGTDAILIRDGRRLNDKDVPNSVALVRGKNGIVLTGQNASGKSTVLRMVGCVVLLAQTVGWTTAAACALEPVKYLTTMINIKDDPEAGRSRFQNELLRAGDCVEAARRRPLDAGLLLMDEIFGGTDPSQGDVCGSKILTSLTETPGCMYVLSTHQRGLVEHSASLSGVRRFRMVPDEYRMVEGVNESRNATALTDQMLASQAPP